MAGTNEILEFAGGAGANKQDYSTYYSDSQREIGHQPGLARSIFENTVLNQTSKISRVLSQFIVDESGNDVLHTDDVATILTNLQLAIDAKIAASSAAFMPSGSLLLWPTETVPDGFLECDGSSLLRETYNDLFSAIGTTYGYADSTHFYLPDYRGYFLRGWDHGAGIDPNASTRTDRGDGTIGDHVGTKQADQNDSHYHLMAKNNTVNEVITTYYYLSGNGTYNGDNKYQLNSTSSTPDVLRTGLSGGTEARPKNIAVMFIIKY